MSVRFLIFFAFLCVPLGAFSLVYAAAVPTHRASCDEEFHEVLEARSWMLASREYETAQEFLEQGRASVLQFTCHDYVLEKVVIDRSSRPPLTLQPDRNDINTVINNYMSSNFNSATCKDMADVWDASRCRDFSKTDFINFTAGEYQEPRSCEDPSDRTDAWDAAVAASQPAAATPAASGGMDAVVTYLEQSSWLVASDCSAEPIETGVKYPNPLDPGEYVDEFVCVTPGCYYDGSQCTDHP